jgi:hypothetical protein
MKLPSPPKKGLTDEEILKKAQADAWNGADTLEAKEAYTLIRKLFQASPAELTSSAGLAFKFRP